MHKFKARSADVSIIRRPRGHCARQVHISCSMGAAICKFMWAWETTETYVTDLLWSLCCLKVRWNHITLHYNSTCQSQYITVTISLLWGLCTGRLINIFSYGIMKREFWEGKITFFKTSSLCNPLGAWRCLWVTPFCFCVSLKTFQIHSFIKP